MILVDIYVPAVDKTYDFNLDENASVSVIIEEIAEMIGQKEHTSLSGNIADFFLCDFASRQCLPKDASLHELGIYNGSKLLLV